MPASARSFFVFSSRSSARSLAGWFFTRATRCLVLARRGAHCCRRGRGGAKRAKRVRKASANQKRGVRVGRLRFHAYGFASFRFLRTKRQGQRGAIQRLSNGMGRFIQKSIFSYKSTSSCCFCRFIIARPRFSPTARRGSFQPYVYDKTRKAATTINSTYSSMGDSAHFSPTARPARMAQTA